MKKIASMLFLAAVVAVGVEWDKTKVFDIMSFRC